MVGGWKFGGELVGTVVGLLVKRMAAGVETGEGDPTVDEGKESVAVAVEIDVPAKLMVGWQEEKLKVWRGELPLVPWWRRQ